MAKSADAFLGKPLPRWLRITACIFGILMLSLGMGSLLRQGADREVIIQMLSGSLLIYISGFEKKLRIDGDGITRTTAFWAHKRTQSIPWSDVTDARVVLNKGRRFYVLLHGTQKIWPLTFLPAQRREVLDVLEEHLEASNIKIEQ